MAGHDAVAHFYGSFSAEGFAVQRRPVLAAKIENGPAFAVTLHKNVLTRKARIVRIAEFHAGRATQTEPIPIERNSPALTIRRKYLKILHLGNLRIMAGSLHLRVQGGQED